MEELGRSYDPLTGLAWSDELRQWGVESLKAGTELTVIFCDLDEFGEYNKRFGHVIGDRVLVQVAAFLQSYVDPARDLLVRYGGDEFVFATLRPRPEAVQLAEEFQSGLLLHDVPTESGSLMSVGIAGGRRTVERENVHFMATLDNLINTASRESTLKKREKAQAARPSAQLEGEAQTPGATPAPIPTAKAPMAVVEVHADDTQVHGLTTVILSRGDALISGVQSRSGRSAVESIALATAKALDRAFPGVRVVVKDVRLIERPGGTRIVEVVGTAAHSGVESEISGTCEAGADVFRAVAQATLQSVLDLLG
ncbi:MAG: GGDEF domain-containing protein [Fimbriimonadaceae bacterium]|nr:GGDEF domain-containing protein [Fimbriimonadaceae bacterium]